MPDLYFVTRSIDYPAPPKWNLNLHFKHDPTFAIKIISQLHWLIVL
jgi:hypothetical protein